MNILLIIGFCYEAVAEFIAEKRAAIRDEINELDSICTKLSDVQNAIERTGFKTTSVDKTYYDMLMHIDMLEAFSASLDEQENYLLDQIDDTEEAVVNEIEKRTTMRRSGCAKVRNRLKYRVTPPYARRRPKEDKYKTMWHDRKRGRAAKEAMAVWNNLD